MSLISLGKSKGKYGVIIDVGSGSVLTAIVHSDTAAKHPMIVWAHREHIALKKIDSVQQSAKAVMSALMTASLKLDSEGRNTLREYDGKARLSHIQCSLAAPWSYTVTKSININQDESIEITDHLIDELIFTAQKQVEEELKAHSETVDAGLKVIAKSTMDLLTNGYRVANPVGEKATSLNLTQATVVAQEYIIQGVEEMQQKLFANAKLEPMSFILMLYCTLRSLHPETDDVCLVDITDEASEIGIVRDGSLKYSTHTPFGIFSLAREISEIVNIPLGEALGYLRAKDISGVKQNIPEKHHDAITEVFDAYVQKLASLLNETGDSLSIPKRIFLHIESTFEPLFITVINRAARSATKIEHLVISISNEIIDKEYTQVLTEQIGDYRFDTALLLNAEFFHKQKHCLDFTYS